MFLNLNRLLHHKCRNNKYLYRKHGYRKHGYRKHGSCKHYCPEYHNKQINIHVFNKLLLHNKAGYMHQLQ